LAHPARCQQAVRSACQGEGEVQQRGIDLLRPLERFDVDREIDQGVERAHRADVTHFRSESTPGLWPGC